jgi:hypothetical protein
MAVQKSFTLFSQNLNELTWTVEDCGGTMVNNAVVVATLYYQRDRINPALVPGSPVPNLTAVTLTYNVPVANVYAAIVPALFNATQSGDYVLVVDISAADTTPLAHWERPAVVIPNGP